jgi:hypothetical protein
MPAFILTDTSGAPFDFRQKTKGYVTLLFFGYTFCPDQCPMHMANLPAALKKLPADTAEHVKLVFRTTPKRNLFRTHPDIDAFHPVGLQVDAIDYHFPGIVDVDDSSLPALVEKLRAQVARSAESDLRLRHHATRDQAIEAGLDQIFNRNCSRNSRVVMVWISGGRDGWTVFMSASRCSLLNHECCRMSRKTRSCVSHREPVCIVSRKTP